MPQEISKACLKCTTCTCWVTCIRNTTICAGALKPEVNTGANSVPVTEIQKHKISPEGVLTIESAPVLDITGGSKFTTKTLLTITDIKDESQTEQCRLEVKATCEAAGPYGMIGTIEGIMVGQAKLAITKFLEYASSLAADLPVGTQSSFCAWVMGSVCFTRSCWPCHGLSRCTMCMTPCPPQACRQTQCRLVDPAAAFSVCQYACPARCSHLLAAQMRPRQHSHLCTACPDGFNLHTCASLQHAAGSDSTAVHGCRSQQQTETESPSLRMQMKVLSQLHLNPRERACHLQPARRTASTSSMPGSACPACPALPVCQVPAQ